MVLSNYNYIWGPELIKKLDKLYWVDIVYQKWVHIKIRLHTNNKKAIVPDHKELTYQVFSGILEQLNINEEKFLKEIE